MKIIIFGCGSVYRVKKREISGNVQILGIIDNNKVLHGKLIDGIEVYSPKEVKKFDYDYIVLMSDAALQMREELLQLGFDERKLIHYLDFFGLFPLKIKQYNDFKQECKEKKKSLLIISVSLSFSGVPVVSLITAKAAIKLGYIVTIAADDADDRYIKEAINNGIQVLICKGLKDASLEHLSWTDNYDLILVNALPMIRLATKLSKKRKVIVWIHECINAYEYEHEYHKFWEKEIKEGIKKESMQIYTPSKRAEENFIRFYGSKKKIFLLALGIEDMRDKDFYSLPKKISFGLVGGLEERKGQDIFLSAIEKLSQNVLDECFFLLIGKKNASEFGKNIIKRAFMINNCILVGERTQKEMNDLYQRLDILVVASREETVSMVAIEAMMMGKVCILSDQTGIAEYIEQGKNGFIFRSENVGELSVLILWCYQHMEQLKEIGENARKTYEQNFSMDIFENSLQKVLQI